MIKFKLIYSYINVFLNIIKIMQSQLWHNLIDSQTDFFSRFITIQFLKIIEFIIIFNNLTSFSLKSIKPFPKRLNIIITPSTRFSSLKNPLFKNRQRTLKYKYLLKMNLISHKHIPLVHILKVPRESINNKRTLIPSMSHHSIF